jgi:hypothetical protein
MNRSENAEQREQPGIETSRQETGGYEDEVSLIDYFIVLWKRKWFICLASVLPALIVGLAIFIWPRDYTITYTYNMGLDEKAFRVLEDTFYSEENIEKLVKKLQASGLKEYAQKLAKAQTSQGLKKIVSFEVSPAYFESEKPSGAKNIEELLKIQQVRGTLLLMCVKVRYGKNVREIASVFRKNFEEIIPLYSERGDLKQNIMALKEKMAAVEDTRYTLNLQLERKKSTLEELRKLGSEGLDKLSNNIVLQFNDVGDSSTYLPLPYQIQATETQTINLEEQIRANKELYDYYAGLLKLNEKLFNCVEKIMPSNYTLGQFRSFLTDTLVEYKDSRQITDYLNAYIKRIENKMANTVPLVEKPKVYPVAKGMVKKSGIVFVAAFMLSVFVAFLLEGLTKNRSQSL